MQIIPGENLNYGAQNTCTIVFGLKAYAYRLSRLVPQGTVVCVDCSRAATSGRAPRLALGWLSAGSRLALGWLVGELLESWRERASRESVRPLLNKDALSNEIVGIKTFSGVIAGIYHHLISSDVIVCLTEYREHLKALSP